MSVHTKVFGVCENKCLVPVLSKEETEESLKGKANNSHTHKAKDISGVALSDHTHTAEDVTGVALEGHTHDVKNLTNGFPFIEVKETNTSLDDYIESGIYYFASAYVPEQIPFGSNGWLLVFGSPNTRKKQIFFRDGTPNLNDWMFATRSHSGDDGWGSWRRLAICEYNSTTNTLNFLM